MDYANLKKNIPEHLSAITSIQMAGSRPMGKLSVGFGLAETVGEEAAKLGAGKALLVTDRILTGLGVEKVVVESLTAAGFQVRVFDEVAAEPHIEIAQRLEEIVKGEDFAVVVGLGGGSPLDMAKAAALVSANPKTILEYMAGAAIENESAPLILLPTTSGTGSETSPFVVTSTAEKKLFISTPFVYPTMALVDPLLTVTMPPKVTAGTGLDALSHGVEGLIGESNPFTQAFTGKCVELVFEYLPRAVVDGLDLEARYYVSFASVMGMMSYSLGGGLYAHSCSYILTLDKNVPHGIGCGVTLPYTLMFNVEHIQEMLSSFAPSIDPAISGPVDEAAEQVVERFQSLVKEVGLPVSLKGLGVEEGDLSRYADELVNKYYRVKNPRALEPGQAETLMRAMWEGRLVKI